MVRLIGTIEYVNETSLEEFLSGIIRDNSTISRRMIDSRSPNSQKVQFLLSNPLAARQLSYTSKTELDHLVSH